MNSFLADQFLLTLVCFFFLILLFSFFFLFLILTNRNYGIEFLRALSPTDNLCPSLI